MPTVVFESACPGAEPETAKVTAPDGGRLLDLMDAVAPRFEVACRSGDCGICLVEVCEGDSELLVPQAEEIAGLGVLGVLAARPRQRLACQARMRPGLGLLRLRHCGTKDRPLHQGKSPGESQSEKAKKE